MIGVPPSEIGKTQLQQISVIGFANLPLQLDETAEAVADAFAVSNIAPIKTDPAPKFSMTMDFRYNPAICAGIPIMAAVVVFDTLKFARRLKEAGIPAVQAEAEVLAEIFETNLDELVTKRI